MAGRLRTVYPMGFAIAAVVSAAAGAAGPAKPLEDKLTGEAIKAAWFDGKPFVATAPDGSAYKMTYFADGKSVKAPTLKKGGAVTGFWRIIAEGYCVRWTGAVREKCFNVRKDGETTVVRFGQQLVATWSR